MAVAGGRRVGLFRALLIAHGQMMVNRLQRGVGRRGLAGLVVLVTLMAVAALPLFGIYAFLGTLFGRTLDEPLAASLMGGLLLGSAVGFGIIGGLLGGARQLVWEAYRSFPVPWRTLFFAETFAGFGDLVVLAFVGTCAAMEGGFVWYAPASGPEVTLLLVELTLTVLFLQHLVGALAVSAVRQLRRAMVVLAVVAWAGVSLVAGAAKEMRDTSQGAEVARLEATWDRVRPLVDALPPVLAVRGMAAMTHGDVAQAALLEGPMLALTLLLGLVSYVVLLREARPRAIGAAEPVAWPRLDRLTQGWSLRLAIRQPTWLLARLHLRHVAGSLQGRFGLVVPLIVVVIVKGPLGAVGVGPGLTLPGAVIYVAMTATQFHFNQFGLDGHGVKTLFLLPVTTRQVLVGKACGLLGYAALQNACLFVLLGVVLRPTAGEAVSAALLAGCLAVAHALEGHWLSVIYPRPLAMNRMNAQGLSTANLLPLAVGMLNAAAFGGIYALAWRLPAPVRTATLALVLAGLLAAYRGLLPRAAAFVAGRREALVEVLG